MNTWPDIEIRIKNYTAAFVYQKMTSGKFDVVKITF